MMTLDKSLTRAMGIGQVHISGNSSDIKPIYINDIPDTQDPRYDGLIVGNGSIFYEIDTGLEYCFDKENKIWYQK